MQLVLQPLMLKQTNTLQTNLNTQIIVEQSIDTHTYHITSILIRFVRIKEGIKSITSFKKRITTQNINIQT